MKKLGFILFPILALGVGMLASYLTADGLANVYPWLEKSPLTPPGYVFPVVWTALYILMGVGLACVVKKGGDGVRKAISLWSIQLALNFLWSLLFFGAGAYLAALVCLVVLWVLIVLMIGSFYPISRLAAWLQVPYLLWVSFAGYLNLVIWQLNG